MPPLIINKRVVSTFREKTNFFNNFFAFQYTPIINHSMLPTVILIRTEERLTAISFEDGDILKTIRLLNVKTKLLVMMISS